MSTNHFIPYPLGNPISFAANGSMRHYVRSGFDAPSQNATWTRDFVAEIAFELFENQIESNEVELEIVALPFLHPGVIDSQSVELLINDIHIDTFILDRAGVNYLRTLIPKAVFRDDGQMVLTLRFPDAQSPVALGLGLADVPRALLVKELSVRAFCPEPVVTAEEVDDNDGEYLHSPRLLGAATFGSALRALMLRELLTRFGRFRLSWVFVLLDPIINISFLAILFGLIMGRKMPGADFMYFITIGVLCWDLVIGSMQRGMVAIPANAGLFSYRQIRPVTVILARVLIEFGILSVTLCIIWAGFTWIGHPILPRNPVLALQLIGVLALLGLGLALMVGILNVFYPVLERVIPFVTKPLYFASAIFFPIQMIPAQYRAFLHWNPLLHGIELMRGAVFVDYDVSAVSMTYLLLASFLLLVAGFVVNALYGHRVVGE